MRKKLTLIILTLFCFGFVEGQELWDLEKCYKHALQNSISIKQANVDIENAELTQKTNKYARLPTLNGSASYSFLFGRSVDPTTNLFRSQRIQSNNFGLNSGLIVYSGKQITNSVKRTDFDIRAASADLEAEQDNLGLNVAAAYLSILQAEDQIAIAENRQKQTEDQLARTDRLIRAGTLPASNRADLEAQLAADEQGVTAAENGLILSYLSLKELLNLDPTFEMKIVRPASLIPIEANVNNYNVDEIYEQALTTQPGIQANEYRTRSAEMGVKVAKGVLQPSVNVFGGVSTNYSSIAVDEPVVDNITIEEVTTPVKINGIDAALTTFEENIDFSFPDKPYGNQIGDNLSENVGVSVNIPIYNGHRNRVAVQRAELAVKSAEYADELGKIQLKAAIQRALTDAKAAYKQMEASEKTVSARQIAFDNAEKKFNLGAINTFEYNLAKDNLDLAKTNEIFSIYDYIFKMKVLDYYLGKPIRLE